MARIVVTGATGFVGRTLLPRLLAGGHSIVATVRRDVAPLPPGVERAMVADLTALAGGASNGWGRAIDGADTVVHLAALAHARAIDPALLEVVNVNAPIALAQAAAKAGVRRMVHLSSVKALGDHSPPDRPLTDEDPPRPEDVYGRSKRAAEQALETIAHATGLSLAILRPPLVHGPDVKANMAALLRLATRWPALPLGGLENRRSLISADSLADAILRAVEHPEIAGTFLVADQPALSTTRLVELLAAAAGRHPWLFPVPKIAWRLASRISPLAPLVDRLTGSLAIDDSRFRQAFDWRPPLAPEVTLALTARAAPQAREKM